MRQQWIEVTWKGQKVLLPTKGLILSSGRGDNKAGVWHLSDNPETPEWKLDETYDQMRAAIEKVGRDDIQSSIICASPTDTTLDVPDLVGHSGVD